MGEAAGSLCVQAHGGGVCGKQGERRLRGGGGSWGGEQEGANWGVTRVARASGPYLGGLYLRYIGGIDIRQRRRVLELLRRADDVSPYLPVPLTHSCPASPGGFDIRRRAEGAGAAAESGGRGRGGGGARQGTGSPLPPLPGGVCDSGPRQQGDAGGVRQRAHAVSAQLQPDGEGPDGGAYAGDEGQQEGGGQRSGVVVCWKGGRGGKERGRACVWWR